MTSTSRWRYLRLAQLVWKLPTYARVVWGLFRDPRTPIHLKAILAAGLVYLVTPIDIIPDALPIIGQADDLTVLLLVLDLFVANAPAEARDEHTERAKKGTALLDEDLARLRSILGDRYDRIRDALPEVLERYGSLRDPEWMRSMIAAWRARRAGLDAPRPAGSGRPQHTSLN